MRDPGSSRGVRRRVNDGRRVPSLERIQLATSKEFIMARATSRKTKVLFLLFGIMGLMLAMTISA